MALLQRRRRNQSDQNSAPNNTGQMMTLSLFIMLLAFFIVLNSISSYEEQKSEDIRESLRLTFTNQTMERAAPSARKSLAEKLNEGHSFDRIEALFQAEIATSEFRKSRLQGVMQVEIPFNDFVEAVRKSKTGRFTVTPSRREIFYNGFLPTLASILRLDLEGRPTRLDIHIQKEEKLPVLLGRDAGRIQTSLKTVAGFAETFEAAGLPQNLLNIGLHQGDPDIVVLTFTKHRPLNPLSKDNQDALLKEGEGTL